MLTLQPPGGAKSPRSDPRREDRAVGRDQGDAGGEREGHSEEDRRGGEEAAGYDEGGEYDGAGEEKGSLTGFGWGAWDWRWETYLRASSMGETLFTYGIDMGARVQYNLMDSVVCI